MSTGPRGQRLPSAVTLIQQTLLVAGEVSWLAALSLTLGHWLGGSRRPAVELPLMLGILIVTAAVARLAHSASLPPRLVRTLLALVALVGIAAAGLMAIPGQSTLEPVDWRQALAIAADMRVALAGLLAIAAWWRGLAIGARGPDIEAAESTLRTGIIALILLLTSVMLVGEGAAPPTMPLVVAVAVVLFAGLVGLPLARITAVGQASADGEATRPGPSGPWLAMLVGVAAICLLATLLVAEVLTLDRLGVLLDLLRRPLDAMIWALLWVIAVPLGYVVEFLIFFLQRLLRTQPAGQPTQAAGGDWLQKLREMEQGQTPVLSPEATLILRVVLLVGLAALGIWLASRALARLQRSPGGDEVEEIHDFVWRWPGLRAIWAWALGWLRRRGGASSARPPSPGGFVLGSSARDLYRQFLSLAAAVGWPRRRAETPLEYAGRLQGETPLPGDDEVRALTDGYNVARYAPPSEDPPDSSAIADALARLRELWQRTDGEEPPGAARARDAAKEPESHER